MERYARAPVALDVPQGSTIYFMLESLTLHSTPSIKVGTKGGISFGDTTDDYSVASGTGILQHNHTLVEGKRRRGARHVWEGACGLNRGGHPTITITSVVL